MFGENVKEKLKATLLLAVYIMVIAFPFIFWALLRDEALTMGVFIAFTILYLIGNYLNWDRPSIWIFGKTSTDMLVAGLATALFTGFNFGETISVIAGVALADLLLTSIALLLLHVASLMYSRELFSVIDAFTKNSNALVFRMVKIISPDVYNTLVKHIHEKD